MTEHDNEGIKLTIDGKALVAEPGQLIIRAAEDAGIYIPRFCDHPLLDPVGACRQCVVEVEGQRKPVMSCTMPVADDMVVQTHHTSEVAAKAQESALEFLLINHPLDCPMCDKGGECPLQDQALAHGRGESRFDDQKRRYDKAVSVSPLVLLDRERCVLCARCTRFSEQISGDPFIELFERGHLEQVAIFEDDPYESAFSGNVIQICPVGALTSTDYRFKARPFDVRTAKTACTDCASGCSMTVQSRNGVVSRQLARTDMAVNEAWTCDRGRFGFAHLTDVSRLGRPSRGGEETTWAGATSDIADALEEAPSDRVAIIHGGRLANEDAWILSRFARDIIGTDRIHLGPAPYFDDAATLAAYAAGEKATPEAIDAASTIITVGLDPRDEAGVLYLRLRKAWRDRKAKLVSIGARPGSLTGLVWRVLPTMPGSELDALGALAGTGDYAHPHLDDVRGALDSDDAPVILVGERAGTAALAAAAQLAAAHGGTVGFVPSRGNVMGAINAGAVAGLLPGGRLASDGTDRQQVAWAWNDQLPEAEAATLDDTLRAAAAGDIDVLVVAGVDLVGHHPDPELAAKAMAKAGLTVVLDTTSNATVAAADIALPVQATQERAGTTTTWFGREQRFDPAVGPYEASLPDWQVVLQITAIMGKDMRVRDFADLREKMSELGPRPSAHAMPQPQAAVRADVPEGHVTLTTHRTLNGPASMLSGATNVLASAGVPHVELHPATAIAHGITDGDVVTVTSAVDATRTVTRRANVHAMIVPGVVFTPHGFGQALLPAGPATVAVADDVTLDATDKVAAHG